MLLRNSLSKRLLIWVVSNGDNNLSSILRRETPRKTRKSVLLEFVIGLLGITMSMLATVVDSLSPNLLIDATSLFLRLLTCLWVVLQQDLPVLVRQKLLRILVELLVFKYKYITAQIKWTIMSCPLSLWVFPKQVLGDVSMSSTELRLKYCPSYQLKSNMYLMPLLKSKRTQARLLSTSWMSRLASDLP
jgi:hypothetical protein